MAAELPGISVLMPTLNAERYLEGCLRSLREQDYPQDRLELIFADAGSTDSTLAILERYGATRVVDNPGTTGEAGRAILNRLATQELILSIDADNYLVGNDWLRRMVQPLVDDPSVFAVEPLKWAYRHEDPPVNRYFSLSGVNDPVSLFMGNYGRYCYLTGRWTEMPHREEEHAGYIVADLVPGQVPTMGANGFLVRTEVLRQLDVGDYYFDIDVVAQLVAAGHTRVAKVDLELGHYFASNLRSLTRKTRRRAEDFLYWRQHRAYPWLAGGRGRGAIAKFSIYTSLTVPLLWQAYRGYRRVPDRAWLYHVPVCWMTLLLYAWAVLRSRVTRAPHSRRGWAH